MNIKRAAVIYLIYIAFSVTSWAQGVYSVVTCPGEDVSSQMNVSWAADTSYWQRVGYVLFTTKKDVEWKRAKKVFPQVRLCSTFDSVYSKTADNQNFYERVCFYKCDAALDGLTPDTEYKYAIIYRDADIKDVHYFKTAGAKKWSACIISDFHSYTPLPKRLVAATEMMDKVFAYDPDIDWVLHLGDICAWGGSYSFWRRLYREPYFYNYMWAGVNGNHDNMTRKYKLSNEFFRDASFYPRNGYEGEKGVCYFFKYSNVLFIMLNNEDMRKPEGLAAAQDWVRKVVAENPAKFIVVCEHYQWFFGEDGRSSQYQRWRELFDELGVDLALSANNHIYVRTNALYDGKEVTGRELRKRGTVYVQTPSSDNERGVAITDSLKFNSDIIGFRWSEGAKTVGAMYLKVSNKKMSVLLMDRYGKVLDCVEVVGKR